MVDWERELRDGMARVDVAGMFQFLDPWIEKVVEDGDIDETEAEALDRIFQDVLEHEGASAALQLAFGVGRAYERARASSRETTD